MKRLDIIIRNIKKICCTQKIHLVVDDSEDLLTNKIKEESIEKDDKKKKRIMLVATLDTCVI